MAASSSRPQTATTHDSSASSHHTVVPANLDPETERCPHCGRPLAEH